MGEAHQQEGAVHGRFMRGFRYKTTKPHTQPLLYPPLQAGAITAVAGVEDGQSVASASASGSLHVWRVDYTCKAGGGAPDKYTGGGNCRRRVRRSRWGLLQS